MSTSMRMAREAVLWIGGALGALCLLSLLAGWLLNITPLVFSSGSMSPAYDAGALGIAREVPADEIAVGDVVSVLDARGDRVTHRVVEVGAAADGAAVLKLRGDANDVADAQVYVVDDADRVVVGVPMAGHVLNLAASPYGLAVGALLAAGAIHLGFTPRRGGGRRATPRRARLVLPVGAGTAVLLGGAVGLTGQVPWAFTSAYWTDSAAATVPASTPAFQGHATPTCVEVTIDKNQVARLTWTDVNDLYEYVWSVRKLDGTLADPGSPAVAMSGVLGSGTTQGQTVQLDVPTPRGQGTVHKHNFDVWVTTRVIANPGITGPTTKTPIRREEGQGGNIWPAKCGYYPAGSGIS